jgi:hypothetical protein
MPPRPVKLLVPAVLPPGPKRLSKPLKKSMLPIAGSATRITSPAATPMNEGSVSWISSGVAPAWRPSTLQGCDGCGIGSTSVRPARKMASLPSTCTETTCAAAAGSQSQATTASIMRTFIAPP